MSSIWKSNKISLLVAATILLSTSSSAYAQESELFDVEPPSAKPAKEVEAPRPIIMSVEQDQKLDEKKPSKLSLFKRQSEAQKQLASKDVEKDVPRETHSGGRLSSALSMPKSAAGVMCGMIVGIPVRAAKTMATETKRVNAQVTDDMTWEGKKPDLGARITGAALSVPYGIATGMVTGVIKGTERAVHTGKRKPLSKESMSISDPELK